MFSAHVAGKTLWWHEDPETEVSFHGSDGFRSRSSSERVGLPDRVQSRHTYRDITVDYWLDCALPDHETGRTE
ncbi:hypothetical protein SacxiDRAFT_1672 [Saccharomonospora xinjiangensis XJ-54]|uniref:Uncharacterized protein n=1 Tax=Saccharomonospora xinjiangensis XJ-54 TaxID=882086 RepID=I0V1B3_9PSEU|nr:hypothetical protein SacxiDRAFT_1672 [Saccharomonospora xinjiangensis XJ-54]